MKKFLLAAQTLLLLFAAAPNVQAQKSYDLKKFPKGCRPEEIGVRLTERYLQTPHSHWGDINSKHKVTLVTYPDNFTEELETTIQCMSSKITSTISVQLMPLYKSPHIMKGLSSAAVLTGRGGNVTISTSKSLGEKNR